MGVVLNILTSSTLLVMTYLHFKSFTALPAEPTMERDPTDSTEKSQWFERVTETTFNKSSDRGTSESSNTANQKLLDLKKYYSRQTDTRQSDSMIKFSAE